ncbi:MAG TPA: hypothetical protein VGY58_20970 [Gemmataceae bacterium]|nr:hypothetical protein [Gemmataceae bacterium]
MSLHCQQCAQEITPPADGRLPPWCPKCGADLKAATACPAPSFVGVGAPAAPQADTCAVASRNTWDNPPTKQSLPSPPATDQPWDGLTCNACGTPVEIPEWSDALIAVCPECGQCLKAAAPWTAALAFGQAGCLPSGRERTKYPGWVGVAMGAFALTAAWSFPGINVYGQWAATTLGGALLVEGLGRMRAEFVKQQPRRKAVMLQTPHDMPERADTLGSLQAVYQTHNSWSDSLAILLFGLAVAFGGLFLLNWLAAGFISAKTLAAAVIAPVAALYLAYRAVRNLLERRQILLFSGGLVFIQGRRTDAYPWDRVTDVVQQVLNDAIDEKAIEISICNGRPPLRFTCAHFRNLDQFATRVQQAFAYQRATR